MLNPRARIGLKFLTYEIFSVSRFSIMEVADVTIRSIGYFLFDNISRNTQKNYGDVISVI